MIAVPRFLQSSMLCFALPLSGLGFAAPRAPTPNIDLTRDKVLYVTGYAHLDTEWNWTYQDTINTYLKNTLLQNFYLLDKYPAYTFNFTGSARYQLMKEYYPAEYERMRGYIAQNRWFVAGSSVDEEDVNSPSVESILRQVLYGNQYFRREFGKESLDVLLPDCFGFPASMPSIWAHAGLLGFSTQKLTWGSAVGIPFTVGVWEGPDGKGVVAALNPGEYVSGINAPLDTDRYWVDRVNSNREHYGVATDYRYYGVGDVGGAPREADVINMTKSLSGKGAIRVLSTAADQMFIDLTAAQKGKLPRYKGDLLLTQHSAGSLTSKAYMKRWNRKNELLADATERAAVGATWLEAIDYPMTKIARSWSRVLGSQMHDILPGTAIPKAYEFANNDEIIALNGFAATLTHAVGGIARALDTMTPGTPLIVYNPLAQPRRDVVEAALNLPPDTKALAVVDSSQTAVPAQIIGRDGDKIRFIFLADVPAVGYAVYSVAPAAAPFAGDTHLKITKEGVESDRYKVTLNAAGDIASIIDKSQERELLESPARLAFLFERPAEYPAWNMDWSDRQKPPYAYVDGPAAIRIAEEGPVRVALEVTRNAKGSRFVQRIRLNPVSAYVEFDTSIDWLSSQSSLKASFPLTVASPHATYNMGLGTIERGNNNPQKYEVPSHEWFDLTAEDKSYGVSILDDGKFGSDKPADNVVRLTLLYTPDTSRGGYHYQASQDWGHHDFTYALYGHEGDHRVALSSWHAARLNQPLKAFQTSRHEGTLGGRFSLLAVSSPQAAVTAVKRAEEGDAIIVRLQELFGKSASGVKLQFAAPIIDAWEVDGQERRIATQAPEVEDNTLEVDLGKFALRSFAVRLLPPATVLDKARYEQIPLTYDASVVSSDSGRSAGGRGGQKRPFRGRAENRTAGGGLQPHLPDSCGHGRYHRLLHGGRQSL